ncbi:MAG: hypothetical protein GF320_12635 [Armatimonadia bacterium]|nr:hypothetical protein [Armatimonadia bacterium]
MQRGRCPRRARATLEDAGVMAVAEEQTRREKPAILLGIANPAMVEPLAILAARLAKGADHRLVVSHMVSIPPQMDLAAARELPEVSRASALLRYAVRVASRRGVQAEAVVEAARDPHQGLVSAVESQDARLLLVGYAKPDGEDPEGHRLENVMRGVAEEARCDLVVAKLQSDAFDSVYVPIADETNLPLTSLLVRSLAETGTRARFGRVASPDVDREEASRELKDLLRKYQLSGLGPAELLVGKDPTTKILERARAHHGLIVGARPRASLASGLFGDRSERLADQAECSVLVVRSHHRGR